MVLVKGGRCTAVVVAVIVVATVEVTTFGLLAELAAEVRLKLDDAVTCLAACAAELATGRLATDGLARLITLVGARIAE